MTKEYLIGTSIIFKPINTKREIVLKDYGKVGKIVGIMKEYGDSRPLIVLKESAHVSDVSSSELFVTWRTVWRNIELAKNQQLLFSFMHNG